MYDTSINYDLAAAEPIQEHRIRGTILSGDGISFDDSNIIEGSFQITNQCTDNNALVFGSCYIGQLTCEFTGLEYSVENPGGIEFSNWIGLEMTPYFGIYSAGLNIWNEIPLGKFTIKEAVHTENGVQITAYDHMTLFDVEIPEDNYNYLVSQKKDNLYYFANYACTQCGVTLGMTKAVFDELPNATSNTENIQIYGDYNGGEVEFHNDIGTYRDLLYWIAQTMCCFATMNRDGELVFRMFPKTQNPAAIITPNDRLEGMTLADYVTHVTGIYVTNLDDNKEMYYGNDAASIALEIEDVEADLDDENQALIQNAIDQDEVEEKYEHGEITEEEYKEQMAELKQEEKDIKANIKQLNKRLDWLNKAAASATYTKASSIELGPNPFLMYGGKRTAQNTHRRKVMKNALALSYTPFSMSIQCGWHYDLGDLIQVAGGRFNSSQDSFCCVMGYTFNLHGECVLEGYGENPALAKVKTKASRQANTANSNATAAKEISSGTTDPDNDEGKKNDVYIKYATHVSKQPKYSFEYKGWLDEIIRDSQGHVQYTFDHPDTMADVREMEWDDQTGGYYIRINGYQFHPFPSHEDPSFTSAGQFGNPYFQLHVSEPGIYKLVCDYHWSVSPSDAVPPDQYLFPGFSTITPDDYLGGENHPAPKCIFTSVGQDGHAETTYTITQADLANPLYIWASYDISGYMPTEIEYSHLIVTISNLRFEKVLDVETGETDGGINTVNDKYPEAIYAKSENPDTGEMEWREIKFVSDADTTAHSGFSLDYKRKLYMTPEVMRAWVKADPPQAEQTFNRYCIRYTGDPDSGITVAYAAATGWSNDKCKADKESVWAIKAHGAYSSSGVQQIAYAISGLTVGQKYWFNFAAKITGATFGKDYTKGLGLVWSDSNSINTNDWTGDPHTYNETTNYLSFYRLNGKRYYEAGVTATATTMYMILTVGDVTAGTDIHLSISTMVISQTQKALARSIYLFDTDTKEWIRYKPFGSTDEGEGGISYLSELNDVEINNPTDGQVLTWDATAGEWQNKTSGGGSSDLDAIELTQAAYNQLTPEQKADPDKIYFIKDAGGSGGGGGGSSTLSGLTDVTLTSPTDGQILKYNGTSGKWENASGGGGSAGENDLLYRGDGSTNAQLISLSSPYTNYDVLIIRNLRFADGLTYKYDMTLECRNLSTNDYIQGIGWYGSNNYWTYQITDADELTYYSDGNDWVLYEIYGVKTGSSGGGGGGNYTETTLYTGSTLVDNMQLSDDISNYNAICVVAGQVDGSNNLRFPHVIPTSQMMDALTNGYEIGLCSDASYIYFTVDSTTEISKGSYQNNFFIAKVIGINY